MNAVLVIDKSAGMTSHDVVRSVRRILRERSVGHLGTLDPLATGVLPLVIGNLTRLAQFYTASEKTYQGQIRFGFATDTYDAEGAATGPEAEAQPLLTDVRAAAAHFRGKIKQMPPPYSAKKIAGVPAYKLARKGESEMPLRPVSVEIKEFEILGLENNQAAFWARVSSGTYMRSVAHEMGKMLGVGAHLSSLCRVALAEFDLSEAHKLEAVQAAMEGGREKELCMHPRRLLPVFPSVTASDETAGKIRHGRAVNLPELSAARLVKVFYGQDQLLCIAERVAGTLFHPKVVLA